MNQDLERLVTTFEELAPSMHTAYLLEMNAILISLERYVRITAGSRVSERKGAEFPIALESCFDVATRMFSMIDEGVTGFDDKMADELAKLKFKYLGK
jgi:hypothetical protein